MEVIKSENSLVTLTDKHLEEFGFILTHQNGPLCIYTKNGFRLANTRSGKVWYIDNGNVKIEFLHELHTKYTEKTNQELKII